MAEIRLRDIGRIVPAEVLAEPDMVAPASPSAEKADGQGQAPWRKTVFAADLADGIDALGLTKPLGILAELVCHKGTETPLTIGLFGPPGSGKSFAMTKLLRSIASLSGRAAAAKDSPFIGEILTFRVDAAAHFGDSPATSLAGALYASLLKTFPDLAAQAARTARDPRTEAREAFEKLHASERKLEAERRALEETAGARARLADTILHQTAGTQIVSYCRAKSDRIKRLFSKLKVADDPLAAFKDMAGALAGAEGFSRRAAFALRSFFAFNGQKRLIVLAAVFLIFGAALRLAINEQTTWLSWLQANETSATLASWIAARANLLPRLRDLAFLGAAAALSVNVWRAFRLMRLAFRAAALLKADVAARQCEMDRLFARQARRVEALAAEVETLSRLAAEAEGRAGGSQPLSTAVAETLPFAPDVAMQQAAAFTAAAGALVTTLRQPGGKTVPGRIVVAIDHLDAVPPPRGREILGCTRALFKEGYAVLIAADPARLAGGEPQRSLDRWIDVPFQLGELASRTDPSAFIHKILGPREAGNAKLADPGKSALDHPISAAETRLLAGLAPFAAASARSLKRFANVYGLARAQNQGDIGALAFMLALQMGGTQRELAAVNEAMSGADPEAELALGECDPRLSEALAFIRSVQGKVSIEAARRAAAAASLFMFDG